MKHFILLVIFLLAISVSTAQVIDHSWFLRSGVTISHVHTFNADVSQVDLGAVGPDQLWDFSHEELNNLIDTTWFMDPVDVVFSEHFPAATVCRRNVNPYYDWEWYYQVKGDTIYSLGEAYIRHVGNSIDTFIQPQPEDVESIFAYDGLELGEDFWTSVNKFQEYTFQATGTLITTPQDTFRDVILIRKDFGPTESRTYYWFQSDLTKELCVYRGGGLSRMIHYEDINSTNTIELPSTQLQNLSISYNEGRLSLSNHQGLRKVQLSIYSIDGQRIFEQDLELHSGDFYQSLNFDTDIKTCVVLCLDKQDQKFVAQKIIVR